MSIRRVDFVSIKPGRLEEYLALASDMRKATSAIRPPKGKLMYVSHGYAGPPNLTVGDCYATSDFDSAAEYGKFMTAARQDEHVQKIWAQMHSADSPGVHRGTGLLHLFNAGGAPEPQSHQAVVLVRAWRILPGMEHVTRAAGEVVNKHAEKHGGHFQILRPILASGDEPNVITSHFFEGWSGLGAFIDALNNDPEIQEVTAAFNSASPPARLLQVHISNVIAP